MGHTDITRVAIKGLLHSGVIKACDRVLDVGGGQGHALEICAVTETQRKTVRGLVVPANAKITQVHDS